MTRNFWSLLVFLVLCLPALAERDKPAVPLADLRWAGAQVFNVLDYGAKADAVRATGCIIPGMDPCSSGGTGTDNGDAFEAAEAAGIATGEPFIVHIPAGHYRFGVEGDRDDSFDFGWKASASDMWIRGEGVDSTFLYPGDPDGSKIIGFCPTWAGACSMTGDPIENVEISGFTLYDDDPVGHGHWHHKIDANSGLSGGTPAPGDAITWGSGDGEGHVEEWDASGTGTIYITEISSGRDDPADTESITDGTWTITNIVTLDLKTIEESHGVGIRGMHHVYIHDIRCQNIGDECIDAGGVAGLSNEDLRYINITSIDSPPFPNGGSTINIDGTNGAIVQGVVIRGGHTSYGIGSTGINIGNNSVVANHNILITGNHVVRTGAFAISISIDFAENNHITISDNYFETGNPGNGALYMAGAVVGNHLRITGNHFVGGIEGVFYFDDVVIENNVFDDTLSDPNYSLKLGPSTNVVARSNTMFGGDGGCIVYLPGDGGILIDGNHCLTNADSVVGNDVIFAYGPISGECATGAVRITNNIIHPVGLASGGIIGHTCSDSIASGNHIVFAENDTDARCISNINTITDNYCQIFNDTDYGIMLSASKLNYTGGLISGNLVRMGNPGDNGIRVTSTAMGVRVIGNRIEGVSGAGVAIEEGTGSDYNVFLANISAPLFSMGPTTPATFDSADVTIQADPDEDLVDLTAHGFVDGSGPFQFTTSGTLPTGLSLATDYWLKRVDVDTLTIAGGPPDWDYIDLSGVGSGTHTINPESAAFECLTGASGGCDGNGTGANSQASMNIVR